MPPRYVYWTILIDNGPTAFRAAKREDLLPTFAQLQRTNPNIVMKWFARGRLWDSPEAESEARRQPTIAEPRSRDWRPGGQHKDPRARFDKRKKDHRPRRDNDVPREAGPAQAKAEGLRPPRKPGGTRPFRPGQTNSFRSDSPRPFRPGGQKPFRPHGARPDRPAHPRGRPGHANPDRRRK